MDREFLKNLSQNQHSSYTNVTTPWLGWSVNNKQNIAINNKQIKNQCNQINTPYTRRI